MSQTVYVLGAGFSKGALAPSQQELIKVIFEIHRESGEEFQFNTVEKFRLFLTDIMNIPEELHNDVPLEDVFTPLDRCLADNLAFRGLDVSAAREARKLIYYLIGRTLEIRLRNSKKEYIDSFAQYLVSKASVRRNLKYQERDNDFVSVISTNWDILLDNSIRTAIKEFQFDKAVVDYCCHISSHRFEDYTVKPGLEVLGLGGFNVKLLKLHGSLNWLQCPRCLRLYVADEKIAISQYENPANCRHCDTNFGVIESHRLVSNLIMPTFLKDLSNPQYKLIWQNAGIELAEASRVVFIGYSLPQADFEMRQLLSRMIRKDARIEVVDYGEMDSPHIIEMKNRYKHFFGNRLDLSKDFHIRGAEEYINEHLI